LEYQKQLMAVRCLSKAA